MSKLLTLAIFLATVLIGNAQGPHELWIKEAPGLTKEGAVISFLTLGDVSELPPEEVTRLMHALHDLELHPFDSARLANRLGKFDRFDKEIWDELEDVKPNARERKKKAKGLYGNMGRYKLAVVPQSFSPMKVDLDHLDAENSISDFADFLNQGMAKVREIEAEKKTAK